MSLTECFRKIDDLQLAPGTKYPVAAKHAVADTVKLFAELLDELGLSPRHDQIARECPQELSRAKFRLNCGTYYVGQYSFWAEDGSRDGSPCFVANCSLPRSEQAQAFKQAVRHHFGR